MTVIITPIKLYYGLNGVGPNMEMSKASVTAVHGLVYIANLKGNRPVDVKEISQKLGIPTGYLAKLFQRLSRSQLVISRRGPQGGYSLATDPQNISFMDVIEAIEGPVITGRCDLGPGTQCKYFYRCKIRDRVDTLRQKTRALYKEITLDMFEEQFA
jgi:Rrf2 family protein